MTASSRLGRVPRQERPRDELGRPLPREADGVEPLRLPATLTPAAALAAAQHLLDVGRPFQAHEVLEVAWKSAADTDRELWRGLTLLAVGITHLARGNIRGGVAVLARAAESLEPYAGQAAYGVDVAGLRRWIADRIAGTSADHNPSGHRPASVPAQVPAPAARPVPRLTAQPATGIGGPFG